VLLLERDRCGAGASGVPYAALWPSAATKLGDGHRAHRSSLWRYPDFVGAIERESGRSIEYRRTGRVEVFASEQRARAAAAEAAAARRDWPPFGDGPVQEILSPQGLVAIEPEISPSPFGGLLCRATAYVNARALVEGAREACIRSGVLMEEGKECVDLWIDGGRVLGVMTPEGPIRAESVLVAAGAWTSRLSPELESCGVVPVKGQVLVLRPRRPVLGRLVKRGSVYLIPTASGDVVVGATSEPHAGFDAAATASAREVLFRSAVQLVPALEDAEIVEQWAGLRPQPSAKTAVVGPVPNVQGLYVASGHYKIGVATAPLAGEQALAAIDRRQSPCEPAEG
jgi:glycine oxidase